MTHAAFHSGHGNNVINLFSKKPVDDPADKQVVRIVPELDHLCMVYSHPHDPGSLFAMQLLAWGIQKNGQVVGIVPWLNRVISVEQADDPKGGQWQGYFDPDTETLFSEPPEHKVRELNAALEAYEFASHSAPFVMQEIPDITGTHALTLMPDDAMYQLSEIYSWALYSNGAIEAQLVDEDKVINTPVLPGDVCLFPFSKLGPHSYYFQYKVANQIKREEPEALQAIQRMMLSCQLNNPV